MRVRVRDSSALAFGSAASGLLAYVFFALVTRGLGAEAAAPVSVLWAYWSFAAAALTFPLQHWIVRVLTTHGGDGPVRAALPGLSLAGLVVGIGAGLLSWIFREPLFQRDDILFPLLVVGVTLGSALVGGVRGVLTARLRFFAVGLVLVTENLLRVLAAVALVVAAVRSAVAYGMVLVAGQLAVLAWPSALRLSGRRGEDETVPWAGFIGAAAGGQIIAQTVLTGGPIVVALAGGGPAEVTGVFAVLALFRAPYTLGLGVVGQATGHLTSLVVGGRTSTLRRVLVGILILTLLAVIVAAAVGTFAGPRLVAVVFGSSVTVSTDVAMLVATGSALALGNLALGVEAMAHGRPSSTAVAWLPAVFAGGAAFMLADGSASLVTAWAFLTAEATAFVVLWVTEMARSRIRPGSTG